MGHVRACVYMRVRLVVNVTRGGTKKGKTGLLRGAEGHNKIGIIVLYSSSCA